jgi:putative flippase GtrA
MSKRIRALLGAIRHDGSGFFQFTRYGLVGVSSNLVFFVVSNGAYLLWSNAVCGSVVGWLFSYFVSLLGHGFFTYKSIYEPKLVAKFSILALWNLLIIQIITRLGESYFGWPYWVTSLWIVVVVPVFSFFVGRHLVFKPNTRQMLIAQRCQNGAGSELEAVSQPGNFDRETCFDS